MRVGRLGRRGVAGDDSPGRARSRRSAALTLATVCLLLLFAVAFLVPVPYVVMSPGITENTLGAVSGKQIIAISGHRTYPTRGHLNMTTVSVTSPNYSVRLPQVVAAWFSSDDIVVPRDVIYVPSQSITQINKQDTEEMTGSQRAAVVAGLHQLGIQSVFATVTSTVAGSPAAGIFQRGDQITSVNGTLIKSVNPKQELVNLISPLKPGSLVRVGYWQDGSAQTASLHTAKSPTNPAQSIIGVRLRALDSFRPPFKIDISLGQDIGGPSAGLMFSLGIYDKLTPGDLTGGRFIAGTGEITIGGRVEEIGGIQQKMVGAYNAGARVFLVPAGNCSEAVDAPVASKMQLIRVTSLPQAIGELKDLDAGRTAALSRCGS